MFVYGDDGSDERRERVTAVAVLAAYEDWWQELEHKWVSRCKGIPFHAKDCESDQGDYKGIPHKENKAMYRDLTTILAESRAGGVGIAIDLVASHNIFPGSLQLAYYRAFLETLQLTANVAESMGEVADITFDISTENEYNAGLLYTYMRNGDARLAKWLNPKISFTRALDSPRVQTADLLAYEAWKALDHTVGSTKRTRGSWLALRGTGRFETFSYSTDWFTDLKKHIQSGELEKIVGFREVDYLKWLNERNCKHNMSNLFRFIDWIRERDERLGL